MALMERTTFNKPRLHFDTAARPSHVTFDDGCAIRRNLPWSHYVEAAWEYATPEQMRIEIGDWIVLITGYNLGPLFLAIEEQTLIRLRAFPEFATASGDESVATEIRFLRPAPPQLNLPGQGSQLGLGIG